MPRFLKLTVLEGIDFNDRSPSREQEICLNVRRIDLIRARDPVPYLGVSRPVRAKEGELADESGNRLHHNTEVTIRSTSGTGTRGGKAVGVDFIVDMSVEDLLTAIENAKRY